MITPYELNLFQYCRAYWDQTKKEGATAPKESDYTIALRKTIFQMYSWLQEKDKFMTDTQVRERWDKNWWANAIEEGTLEQSAIMDGAVNGWMLLEQYWSDKYLQEPGLYPIGINFEFSVFIHDLHYRIHADLILSDQEGRFYLRQFGDKTTEWSLFNNLSNKLEIVGLTDRLGQPPTKITHIDITSNKKQFTEKSLSITPSYIHNCLAVMNNISMAIKDKALYTSPTPSCNSCKFQGKCWY